MQARRVTYEDSARQHHKSAVPRGPSLWTRHSIVALVLTTLAALAPGPVCGQVERERAAVARVENGFHFYQALVEVGRDSAIPLGNGTTVQDFVVNIVPVVFAFHNSSQRSEFDFAYAGQFAFYKTYSELNSWNHAAGVTFTHALGPRLDLGLRGSFLMTNDPSRQLGDSLMASPLGEYAEIFASVNAGYRINQRTSLSLAAANTTTRSEIPRESDRSDVLEQMSNSLTIAFSRIITPRHSFGGTYTYLKPTLLSAGDSSGQIEDELPDRPGQNNLGVGYTYTSLTGLILNASGGFVFFSGTPSNGRGDYTLGGSLEKRWSSFHLGGGYHRTTAALRSVSEPDLPGPVRNPTVAESLTQYGRVFARGYIGDWVSVEQSVWASRTSSLLSREELDYISAILQLEFHISNHVAPYAKVSYQNQEVGEDLGSVFSRYRVAFGVDLYWEPGNPVQRFANAERIRSVLPYQLGH